LNKKSSLTVKGGKEKAVKAEGTIPTFLKTKSIFNDNMKLKESKRSTFVKVQFLKLFLKVLQLLYTCNKKTYLCGGSLDVKYSSFDCEEMLVTVIFFNIQYFFKLCIRDCLMTANRRAQVVSNDFTVH
jgi:hypothetical protein